MVLLMAGRLTPLGVFLKWIVVPASLGAIGYFLVGPRVDSDVAKKIQKKVGEVTGQKPATTDPESGSGEGASDEQPSSKFAAPEVDVTVTALNTRPTTTTRKKRKKRRKPPTESTAPSEPSVAPPPSDGGAATTPG